LFENLREKAALAGAGLASDEGRCWQSNSMSPPLQLSEPIQLALSANERLVHRVSLPSTGPHFRGIGTDPGEF
jgi:hypothetical protein